jgi:hypothetical protein
MKEEGYYNVPTYIEKAIKKMFKLREQQRELASQVEDFMDCHNIPKDVPLEMLRHFPEENIEPGQLKMEM